MSRRDEILQAAYDGNWCLDHNKDNTDHPNVKNCSGFLKSVCAALGVWIPDTTAAPINKFLDRSYAWIELNNYEKPGVAAKCFADNGFLVIAGLTDHVAVVVPGPLKGGIYPSLWCGSSAGYHSQGEQTVLDIWGGNRAKNVKYYYSEYAWFGDE